MSDFIDSELLFNSQSFEDLVQDKLQSQGRGELSSVAPLGIYILLKLKPPTWCLQDFSIYINELLQLNTERGRHVFDFFVTQFAGEDTLFFNLDDSFKRDDLLFLFSELIKVPFDAEKIPYDATGNSLLKGVLRKAFREEDYRKVQVFITQTRESLRLQILDQMKIIKRVKSDIESFFGLRNINFSDAKWADDFAANIIPVFEIISLMIAGPEGAFKMPYLFRDEIARSFIGYIKNIIASNVDEHFACYALLRRLERSIR